VDLSIFRRSLFAAVVLVLCSLVPFGVAPAEPFSGYAMFPGLIIGMYGSAMLAGNFHGVEIAPMLIITSVVNLFFWTLVCYAALSAFRKFAK